MSLTLNTKTYKADSFAPDRVKYYGPAKTVTIKDELALARTAPKPTSTFRGVARQQLKLTRTLLLDDGTHADMILDVNASVPVGASPSDVVSVIADAGDLLDLEEAGTTVVIAKSVLSY